MRLRGYFDPSGLKSNLEKLEKETNAKNFWDDNSRATEVFLKLKNLKEILADFEYIKKTIVDIRSIAGSDQDLARAEFNSIQSRINRLQKIAYFNQEYDDAGAILSLSSGTGGVDAQDWTEILLRMYLKFCEKQNYKIKILNKTTGSEAGIKNCTFSIPDLYAYGNLKSENGVHRLVRISPFSSGKSRETSFALVEVSPILTENEQIKINENDLKIDTFRSSGHGGQSVNTTDSAVRITHLPSGLVVSCQNERSQLQNKMTALNILRSKLTQLQKTESTSKINQIKGSNQAVWGNQIRSYVMQPYTMVKDHRTGYTTSDIKKVLDGNIEEFVKAYLEKINHKE